MNIAGECHKKYHENARAAINRQFRDLNMRIDNVKDTKVQEGNDMLDAKIKTNLKSALNLYIQHKPILPYADFKLINVYSKKKIQLHSNTEFGIFQARNLFLEASSSIHS